MSVDICVWHGDCREKIIPDSMPVHLTVTSPPYWNAIDYEKFLTFGEYYRQHSGDHDGYVDYLIDMQDAFSNVLEVTVPGGFCAVVVGTVLKKGRHYPLPFDLCNVLVDSGWEFHQDIVWHKCTAGKRRAGVFIQKPFPGYYYPNIMTEYIMVFRKPGQRRCQVNTTNRLPVDKLFKMDIANNVWHIAPVPPKLIDHPSPFPEEIPWRLIRLYSQLGDRVLDPFCGSGQTLKVAHSLGRHCLGIDMVEKYVQMARERAVQPMRLREQQLIVKFAKIGVYDK